MKTIKKIFAILLSMVIIATMFIGCSKEESEAVNGTTEATESQETTESVDEIPEEITENVSVDTTVTDDEGNKVITGTDANGNTVEIKTDSNGNVTKTVTDKTTGQKTEETTKVVVKETTTKKNTGGSTQPSKTETTTRKQETTTKKTETTTRKPASQTTATTAHTHNWQAVYSTKKVLVKEAYDEPEYKMGQAYYCGGCGEELMHQSQELGMEFLVFQMAHNGLDPIPGIPQCSMTGGKYTGYGALLCYTGDEYGKPNDVMMKTKNVIHHDAVYENQKYISGYKCSCGATKSA